MSTVDEDESEVCVRPARGDRARRADDRKNPVLEAGAGDGGKKVRQRVDTSASGVVQICVEVLLAGLLLFGSAVVIDGEKPVAPATAAAVGSSTVPLSVALDTSTWASIGRDASRTKIRMLKNF